MPGFQMNKSENDTIKWGQGEVNPLSEINVITFIDLVLGQPPFPKFNENRQKTNYKRGT